jgi:hypothetical protein
LDSVLAEIVTPESELELLDCPECGAAGSVAESFCEVCYAELDEAGSEDPAPPVLVRLPD